jgi:hypothetical protein
MSDRFEIKYILERSDAQRVLDAASSRMRLDANAGDDGRYRVHSLYYDTDDFLSLREVEQGEMAKTKFRLRRYGNSGDTFFEVKSRYNKTVRKTRERASREAVDGLMEDPFSAPLPGACGAFGQSLARCPRRAVVALSYDRIALEDLLGSDLRITIDLDLRCGPPDSFEADSSVERPRGLPPGTAVLELKFSQKLPRWVAQLTRDIELNPRDCSKYVRCVRRWIGGEAPFTEISSHG